MMNVDRTSNSSRQRSASLSNSSGAVLPRLVSGSIGSIVTAVAVTPLEVVKVRQQAAATSSTSTRHFSGTSSAVAANRSVPEGVTRCRGCGTFVLNNGLAECLLPKSAVPYLSDAQEATATRSVRSNINNAGDGAARARSRYTIQSSDGTFTVMRRIFRSEGFPGLYAGLAPTLVGAVPNTVLYFTAYDEIVDRLRSRWGYDRRDWERMHVSDANLQEAAEQQLSNPLLEQPLEQQRNSSDIYNTVIVPLVGGSSARLLATAATSPLELVRTRQASRVGMGLANSQSIGVISELRQMIRNEGVPSLYRGLAPTLWRDVPFSAIYWMFLERFKMSLSHMDGPFGGRKYADLGQAMPPFMQAGHAFVSGAGAGMIAAAFTTPFDVVKTRRQITAANSSAGVTSAATAAEGAAALCDHGGAAVFQFNPRSASQNGTMRYMAQIVREEGIAALWRGNVTRMIKVAPACAIMIGCYELGKRALGDTTQ